MNEINQEEESMPSISLPISSFVVQSDLKGAQIIPRQSLITMLTGFCNCFRLSNTGYSKPDELCLLTPSIPEHQGRNTLVLDLDETLVHSSFSSMPCDINFTIEVDRKNYEVFVLKRPGVDKFLKKCSKMFEVVVFTASLRNYADPLLNILDKKNRISHRLYRESCSFINNSFVKDLSKLGRDINHLLIIDNSPNSYSLQPMNALPIKTWIDEKDDRELDKLIDLLEYLSKVDNIPKVLSEINNKKLPFDAFTVKKLTERNVVSLNRGPFNSPVNGSKAIKFQFEQIE